MKSNKIKCSQLPKGPLKLTEKLPQMLSWELTTYTTWAAQCSDSASLEHFLFLKIDVKANIAQFWEP